MVTFNLAIAICSCAVLHFFFTSQLAEDQHQDSMCLSWMHENHETIKNAPRTFNTSDLLRLVVVCFFAVSAASNGYMCVVLISSMLSGAPPAVVYNQVFRYGRMVSGVCGAVLALMATVMALPSDDPRLGMRHPYFTGCATTAVAWFFFGICANAQNRAKWLGAASNGLSGHRPLNCDGLATPAV